MQKEYIERTAAIRLLRGNCIRKYPLTFSMGLVAGADEISQLPAADVVEVRHGRWEECDWVEYDSHGECVHYSHGGCVCTNCRNAFKKEFVHNPRVNYCPHCGALMDKEE